MIDFVIDGPNGAGKTTVIQQVVRILKHQHDIDVLVMRDPGGCPAAEQIRGILKGRTALDASTQALLYTAARRELALQRLSAPCPHVIFDRWLPSTLVYQTLLGVKTDIIQDLDRMFVPLRISAERVYILMAKIETLVSRMKTQQHDAAGEDRFERAGVEFLSLVRRKYLDEADYYGWNVVSNAGPEDNAAARIVESMLLQVRAP